MLSRNNGKREKKEQKEEDLNEGDEVSEGGSLCTESSWDPNENDPYEQEIEMDEIDEQQH